MLRKINLFLIGVVALPFLAYGQAETLTITTYYPAPFGVYRTLQLINQGEEILINDDADQPRIWLRDTDGGGAQPYIGFSDDGGAATDAEIRLIGDNELEIRGINQINTCVAVWVAGGGETCPACYHTSAFLANPPPFMMVCCRISNPEVDPGYVGGCN